MIMSRKKHQTFVPTTQVFVGDAVKSMDPIPQEMNFVLMRFWGVWSP